MRKVTLKLLSVALSVIMVLAMALVSVFAEDNILDYLTYVINDGEVTIIDCDDSINGDVVIPDTIESYPVTSICQYAFYGCKSLTSISIPDDVTSIQKNTFHGCSSLKSITIPNSVTKIGAYAFFNCTGLKSVTIPDSVITVGDAAFLNCNSLTSITIPDSVTYIGGEAFKYTAYYNNELNWKNEVLYINNHLIEAKDSMTGSYEIKSGTITIGNNAFWDCISLESITIPDSVISIGYSAFDNCKSLTSVTISDSVNFIGDYAFYGCESFTSITVDKENDYFSSDEYGVLFNNDKTELIQYPIGNSRTEYVIPHGVKIIDDFAFANCEKLKSVTISNSVTSIGYCAFANCEKLKSVTLSNSITSIRFKTFANCTNLTSITIPSSVISIGDAAFLDCNGLTSITIPDSVTSIGTSAFYNTEYYNNEANWKNNVLYINNHLIEAKDTITGSYEIKQETITICDTSFYGCTGLTNITIPDSVISIGTGAFNGCSGIKSITIPDSVTFIEYGAFFNCNKLTSVTVPDNVTSINLYAFGYYYDPETDSYKIIKNVTIYGYTNSAAETYANENDINFIALEESMPELEKKDDSNITVTGTVVNLAPEMPVETFIASVENENVQILDKDGKELTTDAFVGTGSKINILDKDGNILSAYEVMVKSDIDGNGKVTPADARLALRAAAGIDTIAGVYETAANYDEKETISTSDARMILRKAAGLE